MTYNRLGEEEEGGGVYGREDGGEWGTLRDPMGEGLRVRDKVVDHDVDLVVHKKGAEPLAEVGVEAEEGNKV
jgi:hypothetical protein